MLPIDGSSFCITIHKGGRKMDDESQFCFDPEQLDRLLLLGTDDETSSTEKGKAESQGKSGQDVPTLDSELNSEDRIPKATTSLSSIIEQPGGWIGEYKLLSVLGEGGMGIVYFARQDKPIRRHVALKLIKPGMDSKTVIARFEAERQTLALLDHPNIAHVYDAGTTESGRPYFVMEYIKGLSIIEHCDCHKLTIEDRLRLFLKVCQALQHAHQKGIIHRDIKPSNILISILDDEPVPKIIDFGVAKALAKPLTERTLVTEQGQLFGTPEYMSPEQADDASEDIDTRSDIYSLGVVLYQLLTGALPFDSDTLREGGIDHVRRVICEQEPETPGSRLRNMGEGAETIAQKRQTNTISLTKRLHRELEWIPLKAMRKDRTRRYRSAAEFADDIENYLRGTPLVAGPESMTYRIGKFVRRHRAVALAVSSVAAVLILATLISTISYVLAVQSREIAEERTEDYRRLLYVNQISLAHSAYREADIDRTRSLLSSCPADLRDFAWSYLWRLCQVIPQTPTIQHQQAVNEVVFSPTTDMLATASGKAIRLWDASTRILQATLEGHTDIVKSLAFSPDGTMLVSGSADQPAILWDVATRKKIAMLIEQTENYAYVSLAFSGSGQTIAVAFRAKGSSFKVVLWDVNTRESVSLPLPKQSDNRIFDVTFSPDDKLLAGTGVQKTFLWDIANRQRIAILEGHGAHVNSAVFIPDSRTLATTSNDGTLAFWDVTTRKKLDSINVHSAPILSMALSPDGALLATGSADSTIRLWDTNTRQEMTRLRGHSSEVRSLAFSPDGTILASASKDGTVKLWEPAPRPDSETLVGHNRIVHGIAFSPDSEWLISTSYGAPAVKMWDVVTGLDLSSALGNPPIGIALCVDLSPDGKTLAIGSNDLMLWDMPGKKQIGTLAHPKNNVNCAVFSPDGKTLATQTLDNTFKLWNVATLRELISFEGYGSHYGAIEFSPDGRRLAVPRNADQAVTLWDVSVLQSGHGETPETILTGHSEQVNAVAFSSRGDTLASGSDDTTIILWDLVTGHKIVTLTGHTSNVHCLAFSPDGRTLASGGNDGTVRLWNLLLHKQVVVLEGHRSAIWDIAFSPDGNTLASSSYDGTIKLWRAATKHEIRDLNAPNCRNIKH
jgi:WD40 repeat protein/serine/threonine protein kinase